MGLADLGQRLPRPQPRPAPPLPSSWDCGGGVCRLRSYLVVCSLLSVCCLYTSFLGVESQCIICLKYSHPQQKNIILRSITRNVCTHKAKNKQNNTITWMCPRRVSRPKARSTNPMKQNKIDLQYPQNRSGKS